MDFCESHSGGSSLLSLVDGWTDGLRHGEKTQRKSATEQEEEAKE